MNENQEIPNGWALTSIQDIADVIMGQSPPSDTYNKDEIGIPFFQGKAEFSELHPIVDKWCSKPNKIAKNNDILLSVRAPVGATNLADRKCCIGRGLAAIRYPHDYKFLYHYFCSIEEELDKKGTGTTFKAISGDVIRNTKLHLPPLPEQHRIVAKIEELFSSLDRGIESLKTAQQHLKVYRQAVLKWAFEGKLTKSTLRQAQGTVSPVVTVTEPDEVAETTDKEGDLPEGDALNLPKGWKWVKSGDLFSFVTSGSRGWAKYYSNEGAIFIRITNLDFDSLTLNLEESKIQYIKPPSNSEGIRTKVLEGDFLFSITGYLGMFAIAPYLKNAFVNQHIALCRPKQGFNKKYVGYWVIAKTGGYHYLNKMTKGATKAGLGLDDIKNFPVPFPALSEQHAIVAEIESRLSVCDKTEESIEQSLKLSESLRQSILKKAFEGKLVPQDPNDEPAAKLLERIKAEKVNNKLSKKGGTRKG